MQLEIKTIIDFGEDGPPADKMNTITRAAHDHISAAIGEIANSFGLSLGATTNMGWTSSGDDEE